MAPFGKEAPAAPHEAKHPSAFTVVGRDTRLVGELTGTRGVRVEGALSGKVDLKAPLEIAEGAAVEAEILATTVRVAGSVTGNITASELVELLASARVKGDIATPALHVVEGARLEGRVDMQGGHPAAAPTKAP